jgi:exonuclease III
MTSPLTVVTWNLHGANAGSRAWEYLREFAPDVALLQEARSIPLDILSEYDSHRVRAMGITAPQEFDTVVLVRGRAIPLARPLAGPRPWIDAILSAYAGNLVACEVFPDAGPPLTVMSVYSPPWPIPAQYLDDSDLEALRRTQQRDVWLTDVLLAALEHSPPHPAEHWIIAGDLNLSETMTRERGFAGGNAEWLARVGALGLTECLRKAQAALTPTFKHTSGWMEPQIDHLFVTEALAARLVSCEVGSREKVFADPLLSDHLPVVATFAL